MPLTQDQQSRLESLQRKKRIAELLAKKQKPSGLPESASVAGDIHRQNKQAALEARAESSGAAPQVQQAKEKESQNPPVLPDVSDGKGVLGNLRQRFIRETGKASEKIYNQTDGSSALRALDPFKAKSALLAGGSAKDLKDLGTTTLGVLQAAGAPLNATAFALVGKPLGDLVRGQDLTHKSSKGSLVGEISATQTEEQREEKASQAESIGTLLGELFGPAAIPKGAKAIASKTLANKDTGIGKKIAGAVDAINPLRQPKPIPFGDGDFDVVLNDRVIKSLTDKAKAVLKATDKPRQRLYLDIADGLRDKTIGAGEVSEFLARNDMDLDTFYDVWKASFSGAGKTLGRASHVSRALNRAFAIDNPEVAAKFLKTAEDTKPFGDRLLRTFQATDTYRRLAGTSQLKTAVRNVTVSIPVLGIGALDKAIETVIYGGFTKDAFSDGLKVFSQAKEAGKNLVPFAKKGDDVMSRLDNVPVENLGVRKAELSGNVGIADTNVAGQKILPRAKVAAKTLKEGKIKEGISKALPVVDDAAKKALTLFNRAQEQPIRKAALELRLLQMKGVKTLDEIDFTKLTKEEIEEAADFALEVTFANNPKSEVARNALNAFKDLAPVTTMVAPYARFMFYNSPRWIFNHSPAGLARLVGGKNLDELLTKGDTKRTAKILSEAITGTLAITAAMVHLEGDAAGDKTQEFKTGRGGAVSTTALAPVSLYLTIAKSIKDPDSVKPKEWLELVTSIRSTRGTPLEVLSSLELGDMDRVKESIKRMAGNYLGMFTVPFRMAKDVASVFDPEEMVRRDTSQRPLLGPSIANIPIISKGLPIASKITEGGATTPDTHPMVSQLTGIAVDFRPEIETALLQAGLNPGKIYPKTGLAEADNYLASEMGFLADQFGRQFLQSELYTGEKTKAGKAIYLKSAFKWMKLAAKQKMQVDNPQLYIRAGIEANLDELEKDFLEQSGALEGTKFKNKEGLDSFLSTGQFSKDE